MTDIITEFILLEGQTTDETSMTLTRPQLIQIGKEMRTDLLSKRQRKFDGYIAIDAATTESEIESITY